MSAPTAPISGYSFVLNAFSQSIQMSTKGTMQTGEAQITLDSSAVAVYNISIDDAKNIFTFSSTSWDISNNIPSGELHYYVHADQWPTNLALNPSNSMLDQPGSQNALLQVGIPNEMLVKHDFVRYLASKLFNTPLGTDLFSNQTELLNDLDAKGHYIWQNDISANLWRYSTDKTSSSDIDNIGILVDASSNQLCTTDNFTSNTNLTRELFQQLVAVQDTRFANTVLDPHTNQAPIPFIVGDSISYLYTIIPADGQETVTGVSPFGGRSYRIVLQIVAAENVVNTLPID
jgi:hypothetical protein